MDRNFQKVDVFDVFSRRNFLGLFHEKANKKDTFVNFDGIKFNRVFIRKKSKRC